MRQNIVGATSISSRKRYGKSEDICFYFLNHPDNYNLDHLAKALGYSKPKSLSKRLSNLNCVNCNLNDYTYNHSKAICENLETFMRQTNAMVGSKIVAPFRSLSELVTVKDVESLVRISNLFDLDLEFECHAEQRVSKVRMFDKNSSWEGFRELVPWIHCNFLVYIKGGKIELWMIPKKHFKTLESLERFTEYEEFRKYIRRKGLKYGINLERYYSYEEFISGYMRNMFHGLYVWENMRIVKVDINQDDHRYEWDGPPGRLTFIEGVLEGQIYSIFRPDKRKDCKIKRSEINILNMEKTLEIFESINPVLEVLTNSKDKVDNLYETTKLLKTTRHTIKMNHEINRTNIHGFNQYMVSSDKKLNMAVNIGIENFNKVNALERNLDEKIVAPISGIVTSVNNAVNKIDQRHSELTEIFKQTEQRHLEAVEAIASNTNKTNILIERVSDYLGSALKEISEWKELERESRFEIIRVLKEEIKLSDERIRILLSEHLENVVSRQAINQFYHYNKSKTDSEGATNVKKNVNKIVKKILDNREKIVAPLENMEEKGSAIKKARKEKSELVKYSDEKYYRARVKILAVAKNQELSKTKLFKKSKKLGISHNKPTTFKIIDYLVSQGELIETDNPKHAQGKLYRRKKFNG